MFPPSDGKSTAIKYADSSGEENFSDMEEDPDLNEIYDNGEISVGAQLPSGPAPQSNDLM